MEMGVSQHRSRGNVGDEGMELRIRARVGEEVGMRRRGMDLVSYSEKTMLLSAEELQRFWQLEEEG